MIHRSKVSRLIGSSILMLCSFLAHGGGVASNVHVTQIAINKAYGTFAFIKLDVLPTGAPACAVGYWQFTLTLTNPGDSQMYAMLLSAYTTGSLVTITGTGLCTEFGSSESLQGIQANNAP